MKNFLKNIIPGPVFDLYYKALEYAAAFWYGFPSRKMIVIGITGTKGKSTTVQLTSRILEQAGFKTGWTSSIDFKIGEKIEPNNTKMTMIGRFAMQKLLSRMAESGCQYAIIETSSEGLAQFRHIGIDYDIAVLTNLSPEHIERHKGFANYKAAKLMLFASLIKNFRKKINGYEVKKNIIANIANEHADDFLKFEADEKFGYAFSKNDAVNKCPIEQKIFANQVNITIYGTDFLLQVPQGAVKIQSRLLGIFNVENMLAAASVALSQGIGLEVVKRALDSFESIAGRMQRIAAPAGFTVFIDYAHEPKSLESVYQFCRPLVPKESGKKLICVLGAAGGGRDKWKRPVMGELAAQYCDQVILTNEDPYDENPQQILNEIESGFSKIPNEFYWKILDRTKAIMKALSLAGSGDIVILTGKGSETCIMGTNNSKIPWNEKEVVEKLLISR
ncbi:UDP-N-acetylmuramoyl-L-alanyl-D-glutamate--2,6-diaminopimelate ligase [Patescibacteria group bacterium]|nr:MAG: UDP-N-acetylmuramoyl-L-alanyl-D-glutamate--2,6-diaminopimelate ligase [Patescibacteria group bacterium]